MVQKNALAIDIGGSKILAGLVDETGHVLQRVAMALPKELDAAWLIEKICELTEELKGAHCCGVTIPGLADPKEGMWLYAPFSGIRNVPVAHILSQRLGLPVYVDNDVNVCAIGEKVYGSCRDTDNFLWITISNGIGGGLVLGGEVYRGKYNCAGEIGHFVVEEDSPWKCGCGTYGCLEAVASGASISAIYRAVTGEEKSAKEIAAFAKAGDATAASIYEKAARSLGKAIACSVNLLNLEKVVLGGGISQDFELLYPAMQSEVQRYLFKAANPNLIIEKTSLGYEAALIGCAAMARKESGVL